MKYITEGFDFNDAIQSDINAISDTYNDKILNTYKNDQTKYALQWIRNNADSITNKNSISLKFFDVDKNHNSLFDLDVNNKSQQVYIKFNLENHRMPFGFNNVNCKYISLSYHNIGNNLDILPYNIIKNPDTHFYKSSNNDLIIYNCTVPNLFQNINHEINYDNSNISINNSSISTLKGLTSCNILELFNCDNITTLNDYIPNIKETIIIDDCKNFTLTNKLLTSVPDIQITNLENLDKNTCKLLNQYNTTTQYYKSEFNDPSIIDITKLIKYFMKSDNYTDVLQDMFEYGEFSQCNNQKIIFDISEDMETTDANIQFSAICKKDTSYSSDIDLENIQILINNKDILENMSDDDKTNICIDLINDIIYTIWNGIEDEETNQDYIDDDDYEEWDR